VPAPGPASSAPAQPEIPNLTADQLAAATPMEQKQMLGEVIYLKIAK
jgi:polyadenylate-binding protein